MQTIPFFEQELKETPIQKLRSKLGSKGDYIKTIWGMGYKFEG